MDRQRPLPRRAALADDLSVDVCIIGAGYTGLWTAYYLKRADPSLSVVVVEREHVGFGGSGRNGGWASGRVAGLDRMMADPRSRAAAVAMQREAYASIVEMGRVIDAEGIDCGFVRGGSVVAATRPAQVDRLRAHVRAKHDAGFDESDIRWLAPDEALRLVRPARLHGATFTPHCAALDPARLVLGLADAVERAGVTIYERSAGRVMGRRVVTDGATVSAEVVVVATEAYRIEQQPRAAIPVYSLMVATEPLDSSTWDEIGLPGRQTFSDGRQMIIYGQRTDDDRIAFGGRGAPYHFGSAVRQAYDRDERTFAGLRSVLRDLFPVLAGVGFDGSWGGPLAIPRDWRPSVSFDRGSGVAAAGGYVGQGVTTANLAGRTLTDLILGQDSDLVRLPWVGHRSPRWEPEPMRWIGVNLGRRLAESIDRSEASGRDPRVRRSILGMLPVG
jgi:glycine/D-amino acid oxidase-like deaminating enzyme